MTDQYSLIIRKCHLFSGISEDDTRLLASVFKLKSCPKGEILFEEGATADGFYLVISGKVKVYKLSPEGKERILHVIQPGNSFADAAIFGDGCYPAFAETLVESKLLFFPKKEFLDLLHAHSQLAINMIAGLSRFLRNFATQIEDLTFRDVPARLARYLVFLAGNSRSSVVLPLAKAQLASNLGTTSETLSRTFRKLTDENLIRVQGKNIDLLDIDQLFDLAESYRDS